MKYDTAAVLMYFSKNYSYVNQDIQVYHWTWTCDSSSLHLVVIYNFNEECENLITAKFCTLSDDLGHDVTFVQETQKLIINYIQL